MDIGMRNQIFIDGRFLTEKDRVRIVVQRPVKAGEQNIVSGVYTIIPEQPLQLQDGSGLWVYAQVMENDGMFQQPIGELAKGSEEHWKVGETTGPVLV